VIKRKSYVIKVLTLFLFRERSSVRNRFNSLLSPKDYKLQITPHLERNIEALISVIAPKGTNLKLKRFGGLGDGSYVLPQKYVTKGTYLISGGIENNNELEISLANLGVRGIQIDNSINQAPKSHKNLEFRKVTISDSDSQTETTLSSLMKLDKRERGGRLIVKLDIEGYEWKTLAALTKSELASIDCLILELHNLSLISNSEQGKEILEVLGKIEAAGLRSIFCQANNGCLTYVLGGTLIPDNMEVTFIKMKATRRLRISDLVLLKSIQSTNVSNHAPVNIRHFETHHLIP
jgi:hypothetical protein